MEPVTDEQVRYEMSETVPPDVIGQLREFVVAFRKSSVYEEIVLPKEPVLERYGPAFSPEGVKEITPEEFRSFLLIENNRHWSGLHRSGPKMCSDMMKLREALAVLVNETENIAERLDRAINMVNGMGKNVATAILTVAHPDRYGVWNNRSEANMKMLGIWPKFDRGESFGNRYVKVNAVLVQLCEALQMDLWTLDAFWWYLDVQKTERQNGGDEPDIDLFPSEKSQSFGLERHLHEFLRDNWKHTELGQEWELYAEPGDEEAGYEYPCDVGRIDLLARSKDGSQWLIVELKRNQTSDQTIGQVLRYMGWVTHHLADEGNQVRGLIICREADEALRYALSTIPSVDLHLYEVEFHLKKTVRIQRSRRE
jgi:hypothetical protein